MIYCILPTYLNTIIQGIIASLLAVFIWEASKRIAIYCDKYRLKNALGLKNQNCLILTNLRHRDTEDELIHYKISYSLGHIINTVNRLNINAQVIPYHKLSEYNDESDIISVGGPLSNDYTKKILLDYKIEFNTTKQDEINKYSNPIAGNIITGFKIKGETFPAEDHREPAIILKLSKNETNQNRSIILIIGLTPQGTATASYFLSMEYKRLYKKFKSNMYYILIYASSRESYKIYERKFIDLTQNAFKQ